MNFLLKSSNPLLIYPIGVLFKGEQLISFGDKAEDVKSVLGHMAFVSYKTQDPLSIHSGQKTNPHKGEHDYFWNYFNLGIDILFDGATHIVKKFVLRSNIPTNSHFDLYRKCQYEIILPPKPKIQIQPQKNENGEDKEEDKEEEEDKKLELSPPRIHPDMKVLSSFSHLACT